jgi:hypothetical protein
MPLTKVLHEYISTFTPSVQVWWFKGGGESQSRLRIPIVIADRTFAECQHAGQRGMRMKAIYEPEQLIS